MPHALLQGAVRVRVYSCPRSTACECMRIIDYSLAVPLIIWSFWNEIARVCVCDAATHTVHASVFLSCSLCCTVMSFWLGSNNVSILLDIYLIHFHSFRVSRASRPDNFVRVIRYYVLHIFHSIHSSNIVAKLLCTFTHQPIYLYSLRPSISQLFTRIHANTHLATSHRINSIKFVTSKLKWICAGQKVTKEKSINMSSLGWILNWNQECFTHVSMVVSRNTFHAINAIQKPEVKCFIAFFLFSFMEKKVYLRLNSQRA